MADPTSKKNPLHAEHHIVSIPVYALTLLALLVLMALTVFIAEIQLPSLGPISGTIFNQGVALAIAIVKASLVVLIFMGVKWSTQLTKFWALLGFTWLAFFTIMAGDYAMRRYENVQGWETSGDSALPRTIGATESARTPVNELNIRPRQ